MYIIFFILLVCAYLIPIHSLPWVSFLQQYLAFFALIFLLPLLKHKKIEFPLLLTPLLFLVFLPLLQYSFGEILYFSTAWTSSLYIFSFFISILTGYSLAKDNDNKILTILSLVFLISSLISVWIAICQWLHLFPGSQWIAEYSGNRPYGNIAQFNLLSTLFTLGIFSALYLYERFILNKFYFLLICIVFLFGMSLTQSRTGWVIIVTTFIFLFALQARLKLKTNKTIIFSLFVCYLSFISALPLLTQYLSAYFKVTAISTALERVSSGYLRLDIWKQMFQALSLQPMGGYGWNQTSVAQYTVIDVFQGYEWTESAHNLFLDILVWSGLPLGILIIIYLLFLFKKSFSNIRTIDKFIPFLMILALSIHSMLEFPLFYLFFLIPFGLLLGITLSDQKQKKIHVSFLFIPPIVIISLVSGYYVYQQHSMIADNFIIGQQAEMNNHQGYVKLRNESIFFDQYNARVQWFALNINQPMSERDWLLAKNMSSLHIIPYNLIKYAQILALNGQEEEAKRQLKILNYTYRRNVTYDELLKKESDQK